MNAGLLPQQAAASTVYGLFAQRARVQGSRPALEDGEHRLSYAQLLDRVQRLAAWLARQGLGPGSVLAVLAENREEWLSVFLAAARQGLAVACPNPRWAADELAAALDLVQPALVLVSPRHQALLASAQAGRVAASPVQLLGDGFEAALRQAAEPPAPAAVDPEDPLLILYTSGTTGRAKGAVLSHRAELARNLVIRAEFGLAADDVFVAWSPLCHMGAAECSLGTLLAGGTVVVVDGFDRDRLADLVASRQLGWLLLMPGMVAGFAQQLQARGIQARGVRLCGVMADLVPPEDIATITGLLRAPYANTFGSTETGCPPCSSSLLAPGQRPAHLRKQQSPFCEVRLVDSDGADVPDGTPGELWMRGPTLFSGYWRDEAATAAAFAGGWYHMGDLFVRHADGTLDFVDRCKYLIKSGGENIYPAEIERVLLADPDVADAVVLRRADPRWGEVPVAVVARRQARVSAQALLARCRQALAGYKQPREIVFVGADAIPRNATGKVLRDQLARQLNPGPTGTEARTVDSAPAALGTAGTPMLSSRLPGASAATLEAGPPAHPTPTE